ncbi:MAG TPA: hypothetical protein VK079_05325 [Bacillota bacterium]|nr:hypothetical protein [Bacillota bacterium]
MKRLIMFVLLLGLMLFTACGTSEDTEQEKPVDESNGALEDEEQKPENDDPSSDSEDSADDSTSESSDETNTDDEANNESSEQANESNDPESETILTGTFVGQADPHTIEIETDEVEEGWAAYQLTMDARDLVTDLEPGDEVTYTYYQDGEMLVIKHIEKIE